MADNRISIAVDLDSGRAQQKIADLSAELKGLQAQQEVNIRRFGEFAATGLARNQTARIQGEMQQAAAELVQEQIKGGNVDYRQTIESLQQTNLGFKDASESAEVFNRNITRIKQNELAIAAQEQIAARVPPVAPRPFSPATSQDMGRIALTPQQREWQRERELASADAESESRLGSRLATAGAAGAGAGGAIRSVRVPPIDPNDEIERVAGNFNRLRETVESVKLGALKVDPTTFQFLNAELEKARAKFIGLSEAGAIGALSAGGKDDSKVNYDAIQKAQHQIAVDAKEAFYASDAITKAEATHLALVKNIEDTLKRSNTIKLSGEQVLNLSAKFDVPVEEIAHAESAANSLAGSLRRIGPAGRAGAQEAKAEARGIGESFLENSRNVQHTTGILDAILSGRRGQALASFSALIRDSGVLSATLTTLGATGIAAVGGIAVLGGALAYLAYEAFEDQKSVEGIVGRLNLFGNATAQTASQVRSMQENFRKSFNLWDSDARKLTQAFATIPTISPVNQQALGNMAATLAKASEGQIKLPEAIKEISGAAEKGVHALHEWAVKQGYSGEEAATLGEEISKLSSFIEANEGVVQKSKAAYDSWLSSLLGAFTVASLVGEGGYIDPNVLKNIAPKQVERTFTEDQTPQGYKEDRAEVEKLSAVEHTRVTNQQALNRLVSDEAGLRQAIIAVQSRGGNTVDLQEKLLRTTQAIANLSISAAKQHGAAQTQVHEILLSQLTVAERLARTPEAALEIYKKMTAEVAKWDRPIPVPTLPVAGGGERAPGGGGASVGVGSNRMQDWLTSHGYSPSATAGIMGNAQIESSFNPSAGLGTAHQGLFQWDDTRWKGAQASAGGKTPDFEQQMAYMDAELQKRDPSFKTTTLPAGQAAQKFEGVFEQSGGQLNSQRVNAAEGFARQPTTAPDAKKAEADQQKEISTAQQVHSISQTNIQTEIEKNRIVAERAALLRKSAAEDQKRAVDPLASPEEQASARQQAQQKINQADNDEYNFYKEKIQNKIALAKEEAGQTTNSANAAVSAKVAAAQRELSEVKSLFDQLISAAKSTYKQDETEWTRLETEKLNITRQIERQIQAEQRKTNEEAIKDAERLGRSRRADAGAAEVSLKTRQFQAEQTGGGGLLTGGLGLYQQEASNAQQAIAGIKEVEAAQIAANRAIADDTKQSASAREDAEVKIKEIQVQSANEILQLQEKVAASWKKLTAPVTEFFNSIGSAIETGVSNVAKAILSPQTEIIHAGLTTIRTSLRGQEIRQAISQMLISAAQDAAKSALSGVVNAIGNMLLSGTQGATLSEKLGNSVLGLFGKGPAAASGVTGAGGNAALSASTTTLSTQFSALAGVTAKLIAAFGGHTAATTTDTAATTTTAAATTTQGTATSLNAAMTTLGTGTRSAEITSIIGSAASRAVESGAITAQDLAITQNTLSTVVNTIATTTDNAAISANATSNAAGAVGGVFGFLKSIPLIGGLFEQGGIVPSAAGGMVVPGAALGSGGTVSILHPREMVLPAHLSTGLQGMINSGASGGSSTSNSNLNYSPTINTGPTKMSKSEFASMLANHLPEMAGMMRQAARNGYRG